MSKLKIIITPVTCHDGKLSRGTTVNYSL